MFLTAGMEHVLKRAFLGFAPESVSSILVCIINVGIRALNTSMFLKFAFFY